MLGGVEVRVSGGTGAVLSSPIPPLHPQSALKSGLHGPSQLRKGQNA